ncbi:MAG: zinc ribbon domain-containing protein [Anaerolineae bacterium]
MSAALGLFRLQQVDSRIGQMESRRRKIQETLDNDSELQAALSKLATAKDNEHRYDQDRRAAEAEGHDLQVKIQQAEASLYGGAVHNARELQDVQADVASLKKRLEGMEERELQAMIQLEACQAARQGAEAELAAIQARLGNDNRHLVEEQSTLGRSLNDLQSERQAAVSAVDPRWLNAYENLRQDRRGLAVAEVSDNSCGACGTTLTAALQQSARHSAEPVNCPSCGRILFAG